MRYFPPTLKVYRPNKYLKALSTREEVWQDRNITHGDTSS